MITLPPKACGWRIVHKMRWPRCSVCCERMTCWDNPTQRCRPDSSPQGARTHVIDVFARNGLTAFEAWQKTNLPGQPPFSEVECEQLESYPSPRTKGWL